MTKYDLVVLWGAAYFGALVAFAARIAWLLYGVGDLPPEDPAQLAAWERRRRWMIISEFCALPLFATAMVTGGLEWGWSVPVVVGGSMCGGALGFGFLLHALQTIVTRRIERA